MIIIAMMAAFSGVKRTEVWRWPVLPARRFAPQKVAALSKALKPAAFQLQGGTSVLIGLSTICMSARGKGSEIRDL
jgi:hypothetical protein